MRGDVTYGAPQVSVVIPTYNGAAFVGETIESVRGQTFGQWELVVHDDGSRDGTVDVARRAAAGDPRVHVVSGANGGVADARNAGLARTDRRSRFIAFLDQDDVWLPEMLQTLVGVLDAHPEYVAAHAIATCIDEHGHQPEGDDLETFLRHRVGFRDGRLRPVGPEEPTTFADFAHSNWILTPGTLLVRRDVLSSVGGFDRDVIPADDWDMAVRVSRRGDVGYVDRALVRWRRHADAQSYASPGYGRAHLRVRHKMLTDRDNTREQSGAARQGYLYTMRATLQGARQAVIDRSFRAAARLGAKALWQGTWYVRSVLTRWTTRVTQSRA